MNEINNNVFTSTINRIFFVKTSLKNRILYLFMAFVFSLATLFICFRPLEVKAPLTAYADTNVNELIYNGSPYSTVFTNTFNSSSPTDVGENLFLAGSNFQIENNFRINNQGWNYYFFSNSYDTYETTVNGVTVTNYDYHTYLTGYRFDLDTTTGYKVYSYSTSNYNFANNDNLDPLSPSGSSQGAIAITNSEVWDASYVNNDAGYTFKISSDSNRDEFGVSYPMKFGVKYYVIFFVPPLSPFTTQPYYRCLELYCSKYFNAVNNVTINNAKFPFSVFNDKFFQGINDYESNGYDSIKFTYYGYSPDEYCYINVYSFHMPNTHWNTSGTYNYNRSWYVEPPQFTESQAYQNGFNVGRQQGYTEGVKSNQDAVYQNGYSDGHSEGYDEGYTEGVNLSQNNAFLRGKEVGFAEGQASQFQYTFLSLLGAVVDAPITALTGLLNFDILGFNLANFFYGLVTIAIIIFVVRLVMAK